MKKKIIDWLFGLIDSIQTRKVTWLTATYSRWKGQKIKELNQRRILNNSGNNAYRLFDVPGAGKIMISEGSGYITGRVSGFSFGVEWGRYGYCSGVLGRSEAKRLAEYILEKVEFATTTEEEDHILFQESNH